jgi:hypothetical protein
METISKRISKDVSVNKGLRLAKKLSLIINYFENLIPEII